MGLNKIRKKPISMKENFKMNNSMEKGNLKTKLISFHILVIFLMENTTGRVFSREMTSPMKGIL